MKYLFVTVILLITLSVPLFTAGQSHINGYDQQLEKGIEEFYQTEWDSASATFKNLMQLNEDDPRAYFFDAMIPFWRYFFAGNNPEDAQMFFDLSEKAIDKSRYQLQENPYDTTMVLMLSGLYGYRGLVAATEKEYKTAIESGLKGYKFTRQLLSISTDDLRAQMGKGFFYYMMGSVPPELRWLSNAMGLKTDKEEGIKILEEIARSEQYMSNDARMMLVYLYKKEEKYRKALYHIQNLCQKYENNVIFHFNYGELLEKNDRPGEAGEIYRKITQLPGDHLPILRQKSLNRLQNL